MAGGPSPGGDGVSIAADHIRGIGNNLHDLMAQIRPPTELGAVVAAMTPSNFQESADMVRAMQGVYSGLSSWTDGLAASTGHVSAFMTSAADEWQGLDQDQAAAIGKLQDLDRNVVRPTRPLGNRAVTPAALTALDDQGNPTQAPADMGTARLPGDRMEQPMSDLQQRQRERTREQNPH